MTADAPAGQPFQATPRLGAVLEHTIIFTVQANEEATSLQEALEGSASGDGAEPADVDNPATRVYSHTGKKQRKHKDMPSLMNCNPSYKVVGRLSPQDNVHLETLAEQLAQGAVSELYVCLPADAPDSMAEMAFRMASVM